MKKIFFTFLILLTILTLAAPPVVFAASVKISTSLSAATAKKAVVKSKVVVKAKAVVKPKPLTAADLVGRLVMQKESGNKLWYVEPGAKKRYYLRNDDDLKMIIDEFSQKISLKDFNSLAKNAKTKTPASLIKKYGGRLIVSPKSSSTIYYLNPGDNVAYQVESYSDFYKLAKTIGVSATDALIRQITMNTESDTYDPAYYGVAYVKYDGRNYYGGSESKRVLPLASLSKVMTALVFMDTNPDWNKIVEITPEEIRYPCTLQACGSTSEVPLKSGDKARIGDLWIAMLSASSNQSARILADNSGMTSDAFIQKMNDKAVSLGLVKTKFVEMSGLSADNVSTAEEFAKIAKAAFDNIYISEATRNLDYVFTVEQSDGSPRDVRVQNRNFSLLAMGPNASKTGFLIEAQRNAVVEKSGNIIIALHCSSLTQRNSIVKRLLDGDQLSLAN